MKPVNINEIKEFEPVEVFGKLCLLSHQRIDDSSIPEGLFKYDLRHGDDWGVPVEIDKSVICNYFGSLITNEELPVDMDKNVIQLKNDDSTFDFDYIEAQGLEDDEFEKIPCDIETYIAYNNPCGYDIPLDRIFPGDPPPERAPEVLLLIEGDGPTKSTYDPRVQELFKYKGKMPTITMEENKDE